jgi:hypothetical protein
MVNIPVVAVALIAGFSLVPESRDPALGRFDLAGALLSVGSISLLVLAVIEAPVRGWTDVGTVLAFAGVIVLLAGSIFWESRRQSPLLDARFFRNARFSAASAISLAFFGFIFVIALYFQLIRGYSTLHAGLATLPFALVMGALSPVAILLIKRSSKKVARAINAASGSRPVAVLANFSGFDGSLESLRRLQLEYGAEIGRAMVNFAGPIVFCVVSRYHGGAFVVFSGALTTASRWCGRRVLRLGDRRRARRRGGLRRRSEEADRGPPPPARPGLADRAR